MKLIVGLGNVGKEYDATRHNIGFKALDKILNKYNIELTKKKFDGFYENKIINNEQIIFLKPGKYMNLSGEVIKDYMNYFKIDIKDILIISDDLDQNIGKIKLKSKGSSGGHNGLKNIEQNLGTNQYKRLKIGISNNKLIDTKNYVLGKLSLEETKILNPTLELVPKIFEDFLILNFEELMNKYNRKK